MPIKIEDVLSHLSNSVEGWGDEDGYYFYAPYVQGNCLIVDVELPGGSEQKFMLEAREVS